MLRLELAAAGRSAASEVAVSPTLRLGFAATSSTGSTPTLVYVDGVEVDASSGTDFAEGGERQLTSEPKTSVEDKPNLTASSAVAFVVTVTAHVELAKATHIFRLAGP